MKVFKKTAKIALSLILTLALFTSIFSITAIAVNAQGSCGENLTWKIEGNTLTISGTGDMGEFDIYPWYDYNENIETVVIESGVESISELAFMHCKMSSISIAEGLKSIGEGAFYLCSRLDNVTLPNSLTTIDVAAFYQCRGLKNIVFGSGLEKIGDFAFEECPIKTVTLPASVNEVGSKSLMRMSSLERIDVASENQTYASLDGVLYNKAFTELLTCPAAHSAPEIPNTVTKIADYAFIQCYNITEIVIPNSVTELGEGAFTESSIKTLNIPDSVISIGDFLADDCFSLTSVSFGSGLTELAYRVFSGCVSLNNVTFSENSNLKAFSIRTFVNAAFTSFDVPEGVEDLGNPFISCEKLVSVTLPSTLKTMGQAFYNCSSLKNVTIPEAIEYIYDAAFYSCESLETLVIPENVTYIGPWAFGECESLETLVIPENVTYIGANAFNGCKSFGALVIPENVTYIGANAFDNCPNLELTLLNPNLKKQPDGSYMVTDTIIIEGDFVYDMSYEVLDIVNAERAKSGLAPLTMDKELHAAAMLRAAECSLLFEHDRPNGLDCFSLSNKMNGENIAAGSSTATAVMNQWMDSPGHKGNILTSYFTTIGIGCFKIDGMYYWVQVFGTGSAEQDTKQTNKKAEQAIDVRKENVEIELLLNEPYASPLDQPIKSGTKIKILTYVNNKGWSGVYARVLQKSFVWSSSNEAVATVDQNGEVTAVGAGKAVITALTDGGTKYTIEISVFDTNTGDINSDGITDIHDIMMLRNHILKLQNMTSEQISKADVNKDGAINLKDILTIRKILLL